MISAHQPAFLPWLGYFHKIVSSEKFVLLDSVQYEKNSFINRNKIKTSNGPLWLTIPVKTKKYTEKTIKDIEIDNNNNWKKKHWKSIANNYRKARYFGLYGDFLEDMYRREWNNLIDIINYSTGFIISELKINTEILKLSDLNIKTKKQQLILDICSALESDIFLFGKNGKEYIDTNEFSKHNKKAIFQNYIHPEYTQIGSQFESNLSVLDLLMNEGPNASLEKIMETRSQ